MIFLAQGTLQKAVKHQGIKDPSKLCTVHPISYSFKASAETDRMTTVSMSRFCLNHGGHFCLSKKQRLMFAMSDCFQNQPICAFKLQLMKNKMIYQMNGNNFNLYFSCQPRQNSKPTIHKGEEPGSMLLFASFICPQYVN